MQDITAQELKTKLANKDCLLYTSDAADERSSVDLGGRRIIKKKKLDKIWVDNRSSEDTSNDNVNQST